jgi:hypothetical protein
MMSAVRQPAVSTASMPRSMPSAIWSRSKCSRSMKIMLRTWPIGLARSLAGQIVRGAVPGLIDADTVVGEVGGERQAAGTKQYAGAVRQDVAEHVGGDHHVEGAGVGDHLIAGVIDLQQAQRPATDQRRPLS